MGGARSSLVLALLLAVGCSSAPAAFQSRVEYRVLERADSFAFGGVGIDGGAPHEVIALEMICGWPDATPALEELLRRAQISGRLYALAGLYQVDHERFESSRAGLGDPSLNVYSLEGCGGAMTTIEEALKRISSGEVPGEYKRLFELVNRYGQGLGDPPDRERLIAGLADERGHARSMLGCRTQSERSLPILIEALRSPNALVRKNALQCIFDLGPWAETAETAVVPLMGDPDVEIRQMAAPYVLEHASPSTRKSLLPIIASKLDDPHEDGELLCFLISQLGPFGEAAVPILLKALRRPEPDLRNLSVAVLGDMGPAAAGAMPAVEEILRSENEANEHRKAAFRALVKIGKQPADVLPFVDEDQRESSLLQLQEVNDGTFQRILPSLVSLLKSSDPFVGGAAASCLGSHGVLGKPALAALSEAAKTADMTIAESAMASLPQLGDEAVPALIALLRDPERGKSAAVILGEMDLPTARKAMEAAMKDPDPEIRERVETYYRPR